MLTKETYRGSKKTKEASGRKAKGEILKVRLTLKPKFAYAVSCCVPGIEAALLCYKPSCLSCANHNKTLLEEGRSVIKVPSVITFGPEHTKSPIRNNILNPRVIKVSSVMAEIMRHVHNSPWLFQLSRLTSRVM